MKPDPPWRRVLKLPTDCGSEFRRRAIFESCKWDPQVEDVNTLASFAIVLKQTTWRELAKLAEALAREILAVEAALRERTDLHQSLALPRSIRRALVSAAPWHRVSHDVRVVRFDFHPTHEGWRLSEANTDVPGGYNEASGLTALVAEQVREAAPAADPAQQLVEAIGERLPPDGVVALVHATAYTDDRQVMVFLARRFERHGIRAILVSPDHLHWDNGRAQIESDWSRGRADFVFRFFPAEWLPNLDRSRVWQRWFDGSSTPVCNPATALLTQSKRLPLIWDELGVPLPTWRRLLPETRDPREVDWRHNPVWVLKPVLGRVGDMVGLAGVTVERDWKSIRRAVRWHAKHWVAQRRFAAMPLMMDGQSWHICLGVYTVNGRAAGIYGRAASQPLINHHARDVAVLLEETPSPLHPSEGPLSYESIGVV